jgi:hypothetical protein
MVEMLPVEIRIRSVGMLGIFLIGVILFDAWQQYYYLTTFDILSPGASITIWALVQSHAFKWMLWALFLIPLLWMEKKAGILKSGNATSMMIKSMGGMVAAIILAVCTISLVYTVKDAEVITIEYWSEVAWFIFFQKFTTFLLGYLLVFYYLYHKYQLQDMEGEISTIRQVRNSYRDLYEDLKEQSIQEETKVLYVKIGNKIKVVPIPDIEWIQSDDYCVRVHTGYGEYVLRKSMKSMMDMLPQSFIRVHRQAIVNMEFMKELVLNGNYAVIMKDGTEVAVAKSRLSDLKKVIETM